MATTAVLSRTEIRHYMVENSCSSLVGRRRRLSRPTVIELRRRPGSVKENGDYSCLYDIHNLNHIQGTDI